ESIHNSVWINYVSDRLAHLHTTLCKYEAVRGALLVWLIRRHKSKVKKEFMPKARIQQVQCGVFHTTVIPINGCPVFYFVFDFAACYLFRNWCFGFEIFAYAVSDVVPRGASPVRHHVCLTLGWTSTLWTLGVHKLFNIGKW